MIYRIFHTRRCGIEVYRATIERAGHVVAETCAFSESGARNWLSRKLRELQNKAA